MYKSLIAIAATALVGVASAQSASGTTAGETANATGRAAAAAVTPGDQNSGRNPENRTGGLMGTDRAGSANSTATTERTTDTAVARAARADRN